jgi:hypothetical protein
MPRNCVNNNTPHNYDERTPPYFTTIVFPRNDEAASEIVLAMSAKFSGATFSAVVVVVVVLGTEVRVGSCCRRDRVLDKNFFGGVNPETNNNDDVVVDKAAATRRQKVAVLLSILIIKIDDDVLLEMGLNGWG